MIVSIIDAHNVAKIQGGALRFRLIHLGQRYDVVLSGRFFKWLAVSDPDLNLVVTDSITNWFFITREPSHGKLAPVSTTIDGGTAEERRDASEIGWQASRPDCSESRTTIARTLESVGQTAEAGTLYRRIAQVNPHFKDAASRAKELLSKPKHPTTGERRLASNGSWFGNAIESFNQLIGSRK